MVGIMCLWIWFSMLRDLKILKLNPKNKEAEVLFTRGRRTESKNTKANQGKQSNKS